MMLTELSGLAHVLDCTDNLFAIGLLGFVFGCMIGAGLYHLLKHFDRH